MTKTQRLCAFCGAPGMTKQHVFGKRLLSLLDGRLGTHLVIDRSPGSTETKKRDGNVWSKQLRRVCSDCNNGWMRRLEEDSFDLLSRLIIGETTIVSKERQTKLAARLAQMIMVAYLSREEVDAITNDERVNLRTNLSPPADWKIFLCRSDNPVEIGQYYYSDALLGEAVNRDGRSITIMAHVTTFVLGKLCVHALSKVNHNFRGYTGVSLVRLWPLPEHDIDINQSSLLSPQKVVELSSIARKGGFSRG